MIWPGMGDPRKRKETIRFLIITAIIGISVAAASSLVQQEINKDNPLKVCINDRDTPYTVRATLEMTVDKQPVEIPARVGFDKGGCQKSLYTLTDDGTIYASWEEKYPFEIGHFLWVWEFPLRDMEESESRIIINGRVSDEFIRTPFLEGAHYKAEFIKKGYEEKDDQVLPPDIEFPRQTGQRVLDE